MGDVLHLVSGCTDILVTHSFNVDIDGDVLHFFQAKHLCNSHWDWISFIWWYFNFFHFYHNLTWLQKKKWFDLSSFSIKHHSNIWIRNVHDRFFYVLWRLEIKDDHQRGISLHISLWDRRRYGKACNRFQKSKNLFNNMHNIPFINH